MVNRVWAIAALVVTGCIDTGAEPVAVPLGVAGTDPGGAIEARGGVAVVLERADLAFGPLTLCAGFQAGDNCDAALVEWTDAVVVDALDPEPQAVGTLEGISGTARSYMYDLGYVSLLTDSNPLELPAAASLGGSYRIEGVAEVEGVAIPFRASAALAQPADVERGIPVVRSRADSGFALALEPETASLTVRFDPAPWVADVDFRALVQHGVCGPGVDVVCDGQRELRCGPAGEVEREVACGEAGQVCAPDRGCVDRIELAAGSQAASAIRTALLAGRPPTFE